MNLIRRTKHEEMHVDLQPDRLTPIERMIDKSDIDAAKCIQALGGLVRNICIGIALIVMAASGHLNSLPSSANATLAAVAKWATSEPTQP